VVFLAGPPLRLGLSSPVPSLAALSTTQQPAGAHDEFLFLSFRRARCYDGIAVPRPYHRRRYHRSLLAQTLKIRKYPLPYTSATPTHITVAQDGALRLTGRKAHCWICYLKPSKTDSWRRTWILRPLRRETVGDSRYSTSRMAKGCSRIYLIIGSECQEND
jgi:hypothetical protein